MHQFQFLNFDKFTMVLLLNRFLGLPASEIYYRPDKKSRQDSIGASVAAEVSENKQQVPLFIYSLGEVGASHTL